MTREQFITNVKATQKAFRRFLLALCCGNSALADDIAQEAYIKAYLSMEDLAKAEKFKSWIYRIGYTTFINHKRSSRPTADVDDAAGICSPHSADDSYAYQDLYMALNRLPVKERTSVLLFYMEDYSIKEIADIEEISVDAVKQQLSRGRIHLRGLLSTNQSN